MAFAINPSLDADRIAADLESAKRLQIHDFLAADGADALAGHLEAATDWRHVLNAGETVFEIDCRDLSAMAEAQRAALDVKVDKEAAHAFQFRFDSLRVPDGHEERVAAGRLLEDFALFLSSEPAVGWFRHVTGSDRIDFADCQATRYRSGAFLTRHDDAVEGKDRLFAYVLSLTKGWQPEWGGLLIFPEDGSSAVEALVPRFNTLTLFEIGQPHSVTQVASYAPQPRFSMTGWLRSRR